MKILQIIYNLGPGGAERLVVDISNELSRQGHDVTLCVLRDDLQHNYGFFKKEVSENIRYINLLLPLGVRMNNIYILYKQIKKIQPDIVHCHLNLVNYLFPLTLIFRKVKFFHTIHSIPEKEVSNRLEYWLRRYFYKNKKMKAITISSETSKSFVSFYKSNSFTEIYNGRTSPKPTSLYSSVKKFIKGFRDNGSIIFLHVGTCHVVKNQKMLIRVFNKLVEEGKNIILLIIGANFDSDFGLSLKNIACDRVIFLGSRHNVADYFLNSDAFCLSSEREGMPISLIEAMACGCIPICTPVGGLINTIKDGENGFLAKSISEEDYYNSMMSYLQNQEKVKKEELVNYYNTHFSIEECVNKHVALYSK
jgi:glycosyltransferase involved in cell wall biosynthesis